MHVQVADVGPCRKVLTIRIPPENVREHVAEVFRSASNEVRIKGFRPGHVPRKVLEKHLGPTVLLQAKESLINRSFQQALREHELSPVGRPELQGVDDAPLDESAPLEFEVQVEVRPQFELGEVRGIEVKQQPTTVTDEDVDRALQDLAQQKRTLKSVDEPAQDNDFVAVDLTFQRDGETVVERKNVRLNTNIPIAGTDPETFAQKLRGAEKGQDLSLDLTFPDNFEKQEVRGQPGQVQIAVHEVLRVQAAPIDDELAKSYDFADLDTMRAEVRRRLELNRELQEKARQEDHILDVLLGENVFPLPQGMLEQQIELQLEEYRKRLEENGTPAEEAKGRVEEAREEARKDAERRLRLFFLTEAVAKKEKIFVTEGDVEAEFRAVAAHHQVTPEQVREYYETKRLLGDLRLGILERKVRAHLREKAKITD